MKAKEIKIGTEYALASYNYSGSRAPSVAGWAEVLAVDPDEATLRELLPDAEKEVTRRVGRHYRQDVTEPQYKVAMRGAQSIQDQSLGKPVLVKLTEGERNEDSTVMGQQRTYLGREYMLVPSKFILFTREELARRQERQEQLKQERIRENEAKRKATEDRMRRITRAAAKIEAAGGPKISISGPNHYGMPSATLGADAMEAIAALLDKEV